MQNFDGYDIDLSHSVKLNITTTVHLVTITLSSMTTADHTKLYKQLAAITFNSNHAISDNHKQQQ